MALNFNYEFINNEQTQSIILLHGFLSSKESMRELAEDLSDLRNVFLVDLPGFGKTMSTDSSYTMTDIAGGLVRLAADHGVHQFDVLGYSMGGRTALALTAVFSRHINKCILESASPGISDEVKKAERLEIDKARSELMISDYTEFLKFWQGMPLFDSQHRVSAADLNEQHANRLAQIPAEAADSLLKYGTGVQPSYWDALMHLENDFYLLAGEDDKKFVALAQTMSERLKNAKLDIVESAGHNVHLENYNTYIQRVREYLKEDNS